MPSPVAELLSDLAASLDGARIDWYLFGAQAAILYGAARLTADVDVTVRLHAMSHRELVTTIEARGFQVRVVDPSFIARTRWSRSSTRGPRCRWMS